MKVNFRDDDGLCDGTAFKLHKVLKIVGFKLGDDFNVDYDELNGKKRIIITREIK